MLRIARVVLARILHRVPATTCLTLTFQLLMISPELRKHGKNEVYVPILFGTDVATGRWVMAGHFEDPVKYFPSLKPLMPLNFRRFRAL
jgi:hypothetical protein